MSNININEQIIAIARLFESGDYEAVIAKTQELYSINVYHAKTYESFAFSLYFKGYIESCVGILNLIQDKEGLSEHLKYLKADCFFRSGNFKDSATVFEDLLQKDQRSTEIRRKLVFSYLRSSQTEKAYDLYDRKENLGAYYSKISIVIPVLDLSPSTPNYNINKLLEDLTGLDAEVIVVFNNTDLGMELMNHPRIDHFAILSENTGVSRAWNIGLDLSRSTYTIIINADMSIKHQAIFDIVEALEFDSTVAMSGPQGCIVDLNLNGIEEKQLKKGEFHEKTYVDLVMGFLFAVKTELFHSNKLKFDNHLTPAFSEEFDIAKQIKRINMKMVAVPTTDFSHGGSGSHLFINEIKYYDQSEIKMEIMNRNDCYLYEKWFLQRNN